MNLHKTTPTFKPHTQSRPRQTYKSLPYVSPTKGPIHDLALIFFKTMLAILLLATFWLKHLAACSLQRHLGSLFTEQASLCSVLHQLLLISRELFPPLSHH